MRKKYIVIFILLLFSKPASAQISQEQGFICPIDAKATTDADSSLLGIPLNQYVAPLNGEGGFNDALLKQ